MWTAAVFEKSSIRVTDFTLLQVAKDVEREKSINVKEEIASASPKHSISRTVNFELGTCELA